MLVFLLSLCASQEARKVLGESLKEKLRREYGPHKSKSYRDARVDMYNDVDCVDDEMFLEYSDAKYKWTCHGKKIPSATVINAEHTVPQSFFNKKAPMVSDLHHLFASPSKLNNIRSNYPFVEVPYDRCISFCRGYTCSNTMPQDPDEYSCLADTKKGWMPRKADRGRVARAIFYFMTMYDGVKIDAVGNVEVLKNWNRQFPPDQREIDRNNAVKKTQGNLNPYIEDYTLVDQVF